MQCFSTAAVAYNIFTSARYDATSEQARAFVCVACVHAHVRPCVRVRACVCVCKSAGNYE